MAKHTRRKHGSVTNGTRLHKPSFWAGTIAIALLCLIISFRLLGDELYNIPPNPDSKTIPSDAMIICLAGGKKRIETSLQLYAQGVASGLFIVGAGPKVTLTSLMKNHAAALQTSISAERIAHILVESESKNTLENAFVVDRYLANNPNIQKIVLVTSGYHMKRAKYMIQYQGHRPVTIIPFTPSPESIDQRNWWQSWLGMELTMGEFFKYLLVAGVMPMLNEK